MEEIVKFQLEVSENTVFSSSKFIEFYSGSSVAPKFRNPVLSNLFQSIQFLVGALRASFSTKSVVLAEDAPCWSKAHDLQPKPHSTGCARKQKTIGQPINALTQIKKWSGEATCQPGSGISNQSRFKSLIWLNGKVPQVCAVGHQQKTRCQPGQLFLQGLLPLSFRSWLRNTRALQIV